MTRILSWVLALGIGVCLSAVHSTQAEAKGRKSAKVARQKGKAEPTPEAYRAKAKKFRMKAKKAKGAKKAKLKKKAEAWEAKAAELEAAQNEKTATAQVDRGALLIKREAFRAMAKGGKIKPETIEQYNVEARKHIERMARIDRIAALSEENEKAELAAQAKALHDKELARHAKKLAQLTEAAVADNAAAGDDGAAQPAEGAQEGEAEAKP